MSHSFFADFNGHTLKHQYYNLWIWRESNSNTHSCVSISFTNQLFLSSFFFYIFLCFNCLKVSYIWTSFLCHINPDCLPPASPLLTKPFSVPVSCLFKKCSVCFYKPWFLNVFLIKIFIFIVLAFFQVFFWGDGGLIYQIPWFLLCYLQLY